MGMFDEVFVNKKHLPYNLKSHQTGWQTKSHDRCLNLLIIDEDDKLYMEVKNTKVFLDNFNDKINFYDNIENIWYEFNAYFENGILQELVSISEDNPKNL